MTEETNTEHTQEEGVAPILYVFSNRHPAPELEHLLSLIYQGVYDNKIGIMQAQDSETDEETLLIVGVDVGEDGKTQCYPLCTLIKAEDVTRYRSPDGKGGFYDPEDEEAAKAVKDSMKPVEEATVDVPLH